MSQLTVEAAQQTERLVAQMLPDLEPPEPVRTDLVPLAHWGMDPVVPNCCSYDLLVGSSIRPISRLRDHCPDNIQRVIVLAVLPLRCRLNGILPRAVSFTSFGSIKLLGPVAPISSRDAPSAQSR